MTILFTAATPRMSVMTADGSVTLCFPNHREYEEGTKLYEFQGVGCVATWGARDGNQAGMWLRNHFHGESQSVESLAELIYSYLSLEFRPAERGADDVGYHIVGFVDGRPRLFHVFYGFDRPCRADQNERFYKQYDRSPTDRDVAMLYNGRNDLANIVVGSLLAEIRQSGDVRYNIQRPVDLVRFCDFVARFAAELTPEVGPPFTTAIISQRNQIARLVNKSFTPLQAEDILRRLHELQIEPDPVPLDLQLGFGGGFSLGNAYIAPSGIAPT